MHPCNKVYLLIQKNCSVTSHTQGSVGPARADASRRHSGNAAALPDATTVRFTVQTQQADSNSPARRPRKAKSTQVQCETHRAQERETMKGAHRVQCDQKLMLQHHTSYALPPKPALLRPPQLAPAPAAAAAAAARFFACASLYFIIASCPEGAQGLCCVTRPLTTYASGRSESRPPWLSSSGSSRCQLWKGERKGRKQWEGATGWSERGIEESGRSESRPP
jgi:hypothetical protein